MAITVGFLRAIGIETTAAFAIVFNVEPRDRIFEPNPRDRIIKLDPRHRIFGVSKK